MIESETKLNTGCAEARTGAPSYRHAEANMHRSFHLTPETAEENRSGKDPGLLAGFFELPRTPEPMRSLEVGLYTMIQGAFFVIMLAVLTVPGIDMEERVMVIIPALFILILQKILVAGARDLHGDLTGETEPLAGPDLPVEVESVETVSVEKQTAVDSGRLFGSRIAAETPDPVRVSPRPRPSERFEIGVGARFGARPSPYVQAEWPSDAAPSRTRSASGATAAPSAPESESVSVLGWIGTLIGRVLRVIAVFIVLGILLAVLTPSGFSRGHSRAGAKMKACISNMKTIEGAVELFNMENKSTLTSIGELCTKGYLKTAPKCPTVNSDQYMVVVGMDPKSSGATVTDIRCPGPHGALSNPRIGD